MASVKATLICLPLRGVLTVRDPHVELRITVAKRSRSWATGNVSRLRFRATKSFENFFKGALYVPGEE